MWFHLLGKGGLVYIPEPLCAFRIHNRQQTSLNRTYRKGELEGIRLFEKYSGKEEPSFWVLRAMRFLQLYDLRKKRRKNANNQQLQLELDKIEKTLGKFWYGIFWLRHRVIRPLENLRRWLEKKTLPGKRYLD
uniref:Uncharacterized protein n=1 Tax=Candidatus Kentrum sp. DK TaxID=2126562 RepID=A0A450SVP0_9GAMM|nr:MAG: hypothetical protein BECKDK2373C_GA0170839_10631 [Candidatus Kentron sp. DK]